MNVRRSITVAAAVLAAPVMSLALASCGLDAPTNQPYNPTVGVGNQSGSVDVLNVVVVSASDGSGTVVAGLANNDQAEADALTGVTSEEVQVDVSGSTEIPPAGLVDVSDGRLSVSGDAVVPGRFVTLTFTFEGAEAITVDAPVVSHDGDYADVPVS